MQPLRRKDTGLQGVTPSDGQDSLSYSEFEEGLQPQRASLGLAGIYYHQATDVSAVPERRDPRPIEQVSTSSRHGIRSALRCDHGSRTGHE